MVGKFCLAGSVIVESWSPTRRNQKNSSWKCLVFWMFPTSVPPHSLSLEVRLYPHTSIGSNKINHYPSSSAFLQFGGGELHLMQLPNPDIIEGRPVHGGVSNVERLFPLKVSFSLNFYVLLFYFLKNGSHTGRDRHIALTVNDIEPIKQNLESRGMTFTMSMSGRRALFCRDLDGNAFEFVEDSTLNN